MEAVLPDPPANDVKTQIKLATVAIPVGVDEQGFQVVAAGQSYMRLRYEVRDEAGALVSSTDIIGKVLDDESPEHRFAVALIDGSVALAPTIEAPPSLDEVDVASFGERPAV